MPRNRARGQKGSSTLEHLPGKNMELDSISRTTKPPSNPDPPQEKLKEKKNV